jgi:regulator of nucleoside diphosphate kinase
MQKTKERLLLTTNDCAIIKTYLKKGFGRDNFNHQDAAALEAEILTANLVAEEAIPEDVVRLGTTVRIKEEQSGKCMELTVVIPEKADIKQKKISILSPIGAALIGFRKGHRVSWKVPAGNRTFSILDVTHV